MEFIKKHNLHYYGKLLIFQLPMFSLVMIVLKTKSYDETTGFFVGLYIFFLVLCFGGPLPLDYLLKKDVEDYKKGLSWTPFGKIKIYGKN